MSDLDKSKAEVAAKVNELEKQGEQMKANQEKLKRFFLEKKAEKERADNAEKALEAAKRAGGAAAGAAAAGAAAAGC